ncbi:hypothetical protein B0T25DRAFT_530590 [Lasiosphaeria hispida]|uniref:Uncharacterized protein n=1 Tax=Lasiosphaeria hispida TaxID=260671 RepID=A0AAJ0MLA1_9PEZI|nr:hypothetical protein B0T25DRAFT_530590 [Lasiosphaeria hispida]
MPAFHLPPFHLQLFITLRRRANAGSGAVVEPSPGLILRARGKVLVRHVVDGDGEVGNGVCDLSAGAGALGFLHRLALFLGVDGGGDDFGRGLFAAGRGRLFLVCLGVILGLLLLLIILFGRCVGCVPVRGRIQLVAGLWLIFVLGDGLDGLVCALWSGLAWFSLFLGVVGLVLAFFDLSTVLAIALDSRHGVLGGVGPAVSLFWAPVFEVVHFYVLF